MLGRTDIPAPLDTPRPLGILRDLGYLYEIDFKISTDEGVEFDGKNYCFAGKKVWEDLVTKGKLTGKDAEHPERTPFAWLKDLFTLFRTTNMSLEEKAIARRIAACWYYVSISCNFGEEEGSDEEEDNDMAENPVIGLLSSLLEGPPAEEDDENDEEYQDDGDEDDDYEDDDEDMEEGDANIPEDDKGKATINDQENNEEEEEEEEEGDEDEEMATTENEEVKITRDIILKGIEAVQAYMPHPTTDPVFFQRMLLKIKAIDDETALWFPWGVPPLRTLGDCMDAADKDPYLAEYAKDILDRFRAAFGTNTPAQLAFMDKK